MNFAKEIFNTDFDSTKELLNRDGKVKGEKYIPKKIVEKISNAFGNCNKSFCNISVVVSFPEMDSYQR